MKKILVLLNVMLFFWGSLCLANQVTVTLENVGNLKISQFEVKFLSDDIYDYPLEYDEITSLNDFVWEFGASIPNTKAWILDTLIININNGDYVRGIVPSIKSLNTPDLGLKDGLVVTMISQDTNFAIDMQTFKFFDFMLPFGNEIASELYKKSETWIEGNQNINVNFVPIPTTFFLLGSGLLGLIGIGRRRMRKS